MTNQTKMMTAPSTRGDEPKGLLSYLISPRDLAARFIRRGRSTLDPSYREVLEAIHRPAK